jgi:hypothetical protein
MRDEHVSAWSVAVGVFAHVFPLSLGALEYCLSVSEREPSPLIMSFRSGDGGQRWLEAQLEPTHKDSSREHEQDFPYLTKMSDTERATFLASFMHTDELTFNAWWREILRAAAK